MTNCENSGTAEHRITLIFNLIEFRSTSICYITMLLHRWRIYKNGNNLNNATQLLRRIQDKLDI